MLRRPPTLITLTSDDITAYEQSRAQRLSDAAARKAVRMQQLQLQNQQANIPPQQRSRVAGATHAYASRQLSRTMDGTHDGADLPPHPQISAGDRQHEEHEEHEAQESSMLAASPSHRLGESFRRGANTFSPATAAAATSSVSVSQRREQPSQSANTVATPQQSQQQSTDRPGSQQDQQIQMQARAQAEQERRRRRQERIMGQPTRGTRGAGASSR